MDEDLEAGVRWRRLEFLGATALAVTFACLFIGQAAEQYAGRVVGPATETAKLRPNFNAIDFATTASIKGGMVVIGPCDTHSP
jgi:hypothetical protein